MTLPIALARHTASRVALAGRVGGQADRAEMDKPGALQGAVGDIAGSELDVGVRFTVKAKAPLAGAFQPKPPLW